MVSPLDAAWNVAKGEAFHPSVAGYMAAGHGGERAARPNAEADNRSRGPPSFVKPSMANMPLRPTLFEGRGKPVGPTGELDTFDFDFTGHPDQSRKYMQRGLNYPYYFDTEGMADRHDAEQELPMLQRSSDAPIDTAWSILKFGYPGGIPGVDYSQSRAGDGMRGAAVSRQAQADGMAPPMLNSEPRFNEYGTDMSHVTRTTDMSGRPLTPFPQFKNNMEMFEAMGRSPFTPQGGLPVGVSRLVHRGTDLPKTRLPVAQVPLRADDNLDEKAIGEYLEALKRERMHRARQMME